MRREGFALFALLAGLVLVAVVLVLGIPPVARGTSSPAPTITTTGRGELQLVPAAAIIGADVVFHAETITAAEAGATSLAGSLSSRLRDMGISSTQTVALFEVQEAYQQPFVARTSVRISVGSLDEAFRASDLLRKVEGVQIKQVRPVARDVEQARRDAMRMAIDDARARADEVASMSRLKVKKARHVEVLDVSLPPDALGPERPGKPVFLEPLHVVVLVRVVWDAQ
ncbi:MAG: SIMPL domain-containing protein [Bacillota bacterium]|nr:SIMPL domain-containing protein [Bacillota bacterium]